MKIRTRYAPSPTGYLHVGGARTALFNYLFAKHNNGKFIVRIEDTDIERNVEGGIESQLDNLRWIGIDIDETVDCEGEYGPYKQTERLDIYNKYVDELLEKGIAYKCFCTKEELDEEREVQSKEGIVATKYSGKCREITKEQIEEFEKQGLEPSIRIKVPTDKDFSWDDLVRGNVTVHGKEVGDWVIRKSNGIPTYNFAVVIDDHLMEMSHILRGEEHISNTPKQIHLYDCFGWELPKFGHMTIITNDEGKKLSKRDMSLKQFIEDYKNEGYCPRAIFNFLTLLGWSPEGEQEIFDKEEIIKLFDINRLTKSPSTFDINKMKWISSQYFGKMELSEAVEYCIPFLEKEFDAINTKGKQWCEDLVSLYKGGLSAGIDIVEYAKPFFSEFKIADDAKEFLKENDCTEVIKVFTEKFKNITSIDKDSFKELLKEVQTETGVKGKLLFMPVRIVTTGIMHGPDLFDTINLVGLDEIKNRL